jgi:hypothetical protein
LAVDTGGRDVVIFEDDEVGYASWLIENPYGYVLNCCKGLPKSDRPMLHRPDCTHLGRPGDKGSTRSYIKICSLDKDELLIWCSRIADHKMHHCQTCDP